MRRKPDPQRDPAFLEDMLKAAQAVASFVEGRSREQYAKDLLLRSAVERQIEIIGEAAHKVSPQLQSAHPEIPWRPIQVQRNRLIHEYESVNDDLIWTVATVHVPALIATLQKLLPRD